MSFSSPPDPTTPPDGREADAPPVQAIIALTDGLSLMLTGRGDYILGPFGVYPVARYRYIDNPYRLADAIAYAADRLGGRPPSGGLGS